MVSSNTKVGLAALLFLVVLVGFSKSTDYELKFPGLNLTNTLSFKLRNESPALKAICERNLSVVEGRFAVYIKNLETGEEYGLARAEPFPAASLYKLVLMAAALKQVEEGRLLLDEEVVGEKGHLTQVLGSVDFGYEDSGETIRYSVKEIMERIGAVSDNFAAIMLTEKVRAVESRSGSGIDPLSDMAGKLSLNSTVFLDDGVTTTASDMATYFIKLYRGEVVSGSASETIREVLSKSKLNNRIPARLPSGTKVIHKTGELSRVRHDAGIVYLEGSPYILVLMGKEVRYEDETVEAFANLSYDVYGYFLRNKPAGN